MKTPVPTSTTVQSSVGVTAAQNVITSSPESTATAASPSPAITLTESPSQRPPLQRRNGSPPQEPDQFDAAPAQPPSEDPVGAAESTTEESDMSSVAVTTDEEGEGDEQSTLQAKREKEEREEKKKKGKTRTPEEIEIERLRQAVHAKMILNQQRARAKNKANPDLNAVMGLGARRVSPIREETGSAGSLSPTLNAAFSSPLPRGAQTASTESTESAKTIRGSVPPTPGGNAPIRTPSYPFPYIPGTPRPWSSAFHQPFTTMSPTTGSGPTRQVFSPLEQLTSGESTPGASAGFFLPPDSLRTVDDEQYPSPNLYDTVLLLNSEPGLEAWWSTVVSIVHRWFGAERATLAVPADASDLENVPWGQKCTFNITGSPMLRPQMQKSERTPEKAHTPEKAKESEPNPTLGPKPRRRPNLETRHSFAGHERPRKDYEPSSPKPGNSERPRPPLRTASHAPNALPRGEHPLRHVSPVGNDGTVQEPAFSDPDFSSVGDAPYVAVFPVLRALNSERDPLIDSAGINRILERGKLVTLTRDYTTTAPAAVMTSARKDQSTTHSGSPPSHRHANKPRVGPYGKHADDHGLDHTKLATHYEEYEQFPSSPWSQSPAPSPAIQSDPTENPFFSTINVDEDSFNPSGSTEDYSKMEAVEAIGVDVASTVTHIPLIHPILSQPMQSLESDAMSDRESIKSGTSRGDRVSRMSLQSEHLTFERKAPIAILSIISSTVPFPQNWTNSLRLLGPHLATSFSNALQYATVQRQAATVRHSRYQLGHQPGFGPLSTDPESLQDLMKINFENIADSAPGSMTSPSDYSSRSRHSPGGSLGGSIGGTPGWDSASFGFATSKHSVGSTPAHVAGAELIDSYFDAKKRTSKSSSSTSTSHLQSQAQGRSSPTIDNWPMRKVASPLLSADPDTPTPVMETKLASKAPAREDQVTSSARESSPTRGTQVHSPRRPTFRHNPASEAGRRPHSLLHSYGADFASSFQGLPAATTPISHTPGPSLHTRSNSMSEPADMPPPSERLLRTIIDSLPVQIFTAAPASGALTWVNSKFLVYRGQDSRQVLQEPWEAIHPDDRMEYMNMWQKSLRTGQQLQQKVRLLRFDGNYRWFYVRAAPLKDKRQNIVHWIGTNMDFHDQHLAELNLARQQETAASEAKYRALANSSPQIVFAVTQSKGVIFCNSQWTSYSGQSGTEACGLGFMDYVHPEDIAKCRLPTFDADSGTATNVPTTVTQDQKGGTRREDSASPSSEHSSDTEKMVTSPGNDGASPSTQAKLSKLASTGILKVTKDADGRPSYSTEVRLRSKDGNYRWHLVRILLSEPITKDRSEEDTWYGTCTDINDHKLLEQTLKETMDAKSRFLSNMSHEIRTPLNGITGMVNFLIDSNLTSEQLEHVNIIRHSTEGLRNLIDDILDLSKVEAGMITLSLSWFHVRSLIEEVNDLMSAMAINKGLELNHVVEDDVPSTLRGDRFRIRQILLNVVGNAIKFTAHGEVFVRCRVAEKKDALTCKDNETMLQFEIVDSGSGFTEKEAEYLFKRFSQIDGSTTRQQGGTGLGLAISMQLAELHGGKMKAASVPGKGSTFTFTIKFEASAESPAAMVEPTATKAVTPADNPIASLRTELKQDAQTSRKGLNSPGQDLGTRSPLGLQPTGTSHASPALSSGSSAPSIYTSQTSVHSERSSASSYVPEPSLQQQSSMEISLPSSEGKTSSNASVDSIQTASDTTPTPQAPSRQPSPSLLPPLYSILVVCPLEYSRLATVKHIEATLPKSIPHQITARASIEESREMLGGDNPVIFTHVILVLHEPDENIAFMNQVLDSSTRTSTAVIVITDLAQKREILKRAPDYNYERLMVERRLLFIFKPLKPSKFAAFFDPQKEREISNDRSQDSAQAVAVSQKAVFDDLKRKLGNKGHRVLLVEDNQINQTVLLKFLRKVAIDVETVIDGVQCTESVLSKPHGYYSIILCDLHMPNKDGYQTCKEIRTWERTQKHEHLPIIALSANVLGDVYAKCVEAGFNSYVTKPVDFKVLSDVMTKFLDPEVVQGKPHEFMKPRSAEAN